MESLSDNIDGSMSYIAKIAISSIYYSIESNNPNEINNPKFSSLKNMIEKDFIKRVSPEIRIDTSLMILSILNYCFCKRADLM